MIFLDASFIVAYLNEIDQNHSRAAATAEDVARGKFGTSVMSDYIFDEVTTVMLVKTKDLPRVSRAGEQLLAANLLLRVGEDSFNSAWGIFRQQRKPSLSFTDCTTVATCRRNGISNICTFDKHFKELDEFKIIP